MKKLLLPFIFSMLLFGCGDDTKTEVIYPTPQPVEPTHPDIQINSRVSVLRTDNNTDFIIEVLNGYTTNAYTTNITYNNCSEGDFDISKGDDLLGYQISLKPKTDETKVYSINVEVKNSNNGKEWKENNINLAVFHKLHPTFDVDGNIPAFDWEKLDIESGTSKIFLLTPYRNEYKFTHNESGAWAESAQTLSPIIVSYGFDNLKDNSTVSGGFTIDNTNSTFEIHGKQYQNCIELRSVSEQCAMSIKYDGTVEQDKAFTINLQDKYLPTTINLKGTPAPIVP